MDVDIWAARSVAQVFDRIGVDYPRTPKTGEPSFTQNWLVNCDNPIAQLIRQAREINKFHSTFIDSIQRYVHKGRIHSEINQLRSDQGWNSIRTFIIFESKPPTNTCKKQGVWR